MTCSGISPSIDLLGKRVVVTGGARGIGAACCRLFAGAGAAVLVHYGAGEERAREVLESLPEVSSLHLLFGTEIGDEAGVGEMFALVAERWGGLDAASLRRTLKVNVTGPVLFLASLLARQITGEILNVNGGSVLVG